MYDQPTEINCIRGVLVVPQCNVSVFISFVILVKNYCALHCNYLFDFFLPLYHKFLRQNPDSRKNYLNMIKKAKYQHHGSKGVKVINVCKSTVSFLQFTLSLCLSNSRIRRPDIEEAPFAASLAAFRRWPFLLFCPKALCLWHLIKTAGEFQVQTLEI